MTNNIDIEGFETVSDTVLIDSGGSTRQLIRTPYLTAVGKKLRLKKLAISQASGLPVSVVIWDQDLSSATAVGRGSATGYLLNLFAGATNTSGSAGTRTYTEDELPDLSFEAGVCLQGSTFGINVVGEFFRN